MSDPYYDRKPVPDEFIEHVGPTGLDKQEEYLNRERKFSTEGGDLRKFSNPVGKNGTLDPHYARKPVPDDMIKGVGLTGLTKEQEYLNREKKYTANGADLRKFSTSMKGGLEPLADPYYGRKPVNEAEIDGVGDTGYSKAEDYEIRERKQSVFQLSSDPFAQVSGSGHRQSVSGVASAGAADARRKSSAIGPDASSAVKNVGAHQHGTAAHSGYTGESLGPIESRTEAPTNFPGTNTTTTTTTSTNNTSGLYHDKVTDDDVGPLDVR